MTTRKKHTRRMIGILASVFMLAITAVATYAQDPTPEPNAETCVGCHEGLRVHWAESPHGQATSNPVFVQQWQEQGAPKECLQCHTTGYDPLTGEYKEEGVNCLTCHSPVVANHPDAIMPTDVSARNCGDCHVETFNEWEVSQHGEDNLSCNECHNPHTTELRAGHSQELCQSCHHQESHYFAQTGHASEGLLCTDCHLRVETETPLGDGHGQRHHTFAVDLQTCNQCHGEEMHTAPSDIQNAVMPGGSDVACYPAELTMQVASTAGAAAAESVTVTPEPTGPSPWVYILPAGIGLVFGALLAPSIEGALKKRREDETGEK